MNLGSKDLQELQQKINYKFKNSDLLVESMTHTSYKNEHKWKFDYERLEFLGDAILEAVVSEYLCKEFPEAAEGELTKVRSALVSEKALSEITRKMELDRCVLLGKGEEKSGGQNKASILSDVLEALVGAIFLDGGYDSAREFITRCVICGSIPKNEDYKTKLQEITQNRNHELHYEVLSESGKDHEKVFCIAVYLNEALLGQGLGKSKKEAEQKAAEDALNYLLKSSSDVIQK